MTTDEILASDAVAVVILINYLGIKFASNMYLNYFQDMGHSRVGNGSYNNANFSGPLIVWRWQWIVFYEWEVSLLDCVHHILFIIQNKYYIIIILIKMYTKGWRLWRHERDI